MFREIERSSGGVLPSAEQLIKNDSQKQAVSFQGTETGNILSLWEDIRMNPHGAQRHNQT